MLFNFIVYPHFDVTSKLTQPPQMLIFFLKVNAKFYIVKVKFAIVFNFHFDVFNAFKSATFTLTFDQNVNICIYIVTL